MADYSVDIEVGIKGAQRLTKFRKDINRTAKEVDGLNLQIRKASGNKFENSIDRLNASVSKTSQILNRAAIGTSSFTKAANLFVKAERERDMVLKDTQRSLENIRRSQLGMQTLEQREHQLLMRGNRLRDLRLRKEQALNKQQQKSRRNRIIQSAGIGGGFPLLFGGGPVAAIAGGLGGGIGEALSPRGGFAGSIVATALISSVNQMIDSLSKLGQEMNKSAEEFKRVQDIVGTEGADSLSEFGAETKLLGDEFGKFTLRAQSGIAGLINITGILDDLIKGIQTRNLRAQIKDSDDPEIQALVKAGGRRTQGVLGRRRTENLSQAEGLQLEKNLRKQIREESEKQQSIVDQILLPLEREVRLNDETNEITKLGIRSLNEKEDILNKIKASNVEITEEIENQVAALVDSKYERLQNLQLGKEFAEKVLKPQMEAMEKQEKEDFDAGARLGKRIATENKMLDTMEKSIEKSKLERELQKAKTVEERANIELKLIELSLGDSITNFNKEDLRTLLEKKIAYDDLNKALTEQERIVKEIQFTFASSMSNAIKGLITGTHNLNSALSSVLNKMAEAMLNMGLFGNVGGSLTKGGGLLGTIFGGLLHEGGPARRGSSYIVGEKGPELFTPGVSGMVTPNNALGGSNNIVVNVDASGTQVEGDEASSSQLGKLIGLAVQQELVKQSRAGGLLSRA